jgi:polyisoprenoid-binding protein YceI
MRFHLALGIATLLAATPAAAAPTAPSASYAFGAGTEVRYLVVHRMHQVHGQTGTLEGNVKLDAGKLALPLKITLPLLTFKSGNRNRDDNALAALDAGRFPKAILNVEHFTQTSGGVAGDRWTSNGTAEGTLSVRGIAKPVKLPIQASVANDTLTIDTSFIVKLSDHAIPAPALLFVPVKDEVQVEVHGVAKKI